MIISISEDFTDTPGGRYIEQSEFSGELFRNTILIPKIQECIKRNEALIINLDGTYGYPTSFLDEAFGKLINYFKKKELELISFISEDEPGLINDIYTYMENNKK